MKFTTSLSLLSDAMQLHDRHERSGKFMVTENQPDTLQSDIQLAVTDDDCIIASDYYTNRIVSLNSTFSCQRDLSLSLDDERHKPHRTYYREPCSKLNVSETTGRVLIFENISDISYINS
jgi:hypothetical protein